MNNCAQGRNSLPQKLATNRKGSLMKATALRLLSTLVGFVAAAHISQAADLTAKPGAVFVMTNSASKNEILSYQRTPDGSLYIGDRYETGGRGSGGVTDPLESQGSLTLSQDRSLLFAVNAGSGTVSVFGVRRSQLWLIDKAPTGGSQPVAVAQWHDLVYVLNSGGSGTVTGFQFGHDGKLTRIKRASAFLSANATGGASITISPDGQFLVVTERLANTIDTFRIKADGTLTPIVVNESLAAGVFSANFAPEGNLVVSETGVAGVANGSAVSSYIVNADGKLTVISQSVPTLGAANCWNAFTPNGKYVYVSNAGTANISGFAISPNGMLTPIGATVVGTNPEGSTNLDISVSSNGKFLYTLNSGTGTVGIFGIQADGTLTSLGEASGLPASAGFNGIAVL
jgi:6-phosphogluconolactonase